jgi:hypothetical protein
MKKKYPYRYKTEEEFIKEFGSDWKNIIKWSDFDNRLFGNDFEFTEFEIKNIFIKLKIWNIVKELITTDIKKPSYKPRKLDKTI